MTAITTIETIDEFIAAKRITPKTLISNRAFTNSIITPSQVKTSHIYTLVFMASCIN
jgi:hypothetical protein